MYKLIASDLDNTLLRTDKTISEETINELKRCNDLGIYFVPSTGRTHAELPEPVMNLPFLRYAITCNGGGLYDFKEGEYLESFEIDNEDAIKVLEFAKDLPVHTSMVCKGIRYIEADEKGEIPEYVCKTAVKILLKTAKPVKGLVEFLKERKIGVQKFLFYPNDISVADEVVEKLNKKFDFLAIAKSGPLFVEINAKGINKGRTLELLCEHLGIAVEDTIGFGDADNDIGLLDSAGLSVVMANGTDEAKRHADIICESCDDDGLRKTLERLVK